MRSATCAGSDPRDRTRRDSGRRRSPRNEGFRELVEQCRLARTSWTRDPGVDPRHRVEDLPHESSASSQPIVPGIRPPIDESGRLMARTGAARWVRRRVGGRLGQGWDRAPARATIRTGSGTGSSLDGIGTGSGTVAATDPARVRATGRARTGSTTDRSRGGIRWRLSLGSRGRSARRRRGRRRRRRWRGQRAGRRGTSSGAVPSGSEPSSRWNTGATGSRSGAAPVSTGRPARRSVARGPIRAVVGLLLRAHRQWSDRDQHGEERGGDTGEHRGPKSERHAMGGITAATRPPGLRRKRAADAPIAAAWPSRSTMAGTTIEPRVRRPRRRG